MSWVAKLLSFVRIVRNGANVSDATINTGGGENHTAEHFAPPGDDSHPLAGDYVLASDIPRSGSKAAIGYIDPVNTPKALTGDKRIYARDSAGVEIAEVWLSNDGKILAQNANGSILLKTNGSVTITSPGATVDIDQGGTTTVNGVVTIDASGNIVTPGTIQCSGLTAIGGGASVVAPSAVINGKELDGHTHSQGNDSAGDSQVNTSGNL